MKKLLHFIVVLLCGCLSLNLVAQTSCTGQLAPNVITNGDFGMGAANIQASNPFYAPDYVYESNTAPAEGEYTIAQISQLLDHDCWVNTVDNSGQTNGYFMLINTSPDEDIIYQRTLEVCDGISYLFSIDLINLRASNCQPTGLLPNIDILINGQVVLSCGDLIQDENWHHFDQLIEITNGVDIATLTIRNNTLGATGNDLGLDNISLRHCGPVLNLPSTTFLCEDGGSIILDELSISYPMPYYQWQRSFDGGQIWQDIDDENTSILDLNQPIEGVSYRVLVANGPVNFLSESCRFSSNATRVEILEPIEVYRTPVICEGDSVLVGEEWLFQEGEYVTFIPGVSGCDSIIHTYLFTNPSYDHWFSQLLCQGDMFLGQTFERDTIIERAFTTIAGCDSMTRYEINVFSIENLQILGETTVCEGELATLSMEANYPEYNWNTGATTSSIQVGVTGEYILTVGNAQGCNSSTSVSVTVSNPFMEIMVDDPSCPMINDGVLEVIYYEDGIAPYTFSLDGVNWTDEPLFTELSPNSYTVQLRDNIGCENTQTFIINESDGFDVEINGIPENGVDSGDTLHLEVISLETNLDYRWSGDGLFDCTNCSRVEWFPFNDGQLHLEIENSAGCSQIIDATVQILNPVRVYIPNVFSPNGDGNNDTFAPEVGENVAAINTWSIYDRWGGEMFAQNNRSPSDPSLGWDGTWRGEEMEAGVYLYRAEVTFNKGQSKIFSGEVILVR